MGSFRAQVVGFIEDAIILQGEARKSPIVVFGACGEVTSRKPIIIVARNNLVDEAFKLDGKATLQPTTVA